MSLSLIRALLLGASLLAPQESPPPAGAAEQDTETGNTAIEVAPAQADEHRIGSLFEGALVGAKDAQDFAETPGFRRLLQMIANYGEDELRAKATRLLDVEAALAAPAEWRGELVQLRGVVVDVRAVRLSDPIGGNVDVWRAIVGEADDDSPRRTPEGRPIERPCVIVDFLRPPPELEFRRDVIDAEGVFFRTVRYENRQGEFKEAPYVIARGVSRLDVEQLPKRTAFDPKIAILAAIAGAYFVARVFLSLRPKKRKEHLESERAARLIRERARVPRPAARQTPKSTPDSSP